MVEILGHGAHRGLALLRHHGAEEFIVGGRGRGTGILRVKRQEQDLLAPRLHHPVHHRPGGGVAVAHAVIDHHLCAVTRRNRRRKLCHLRLGDGHQRAFIRLGVPDQPVVRARGEGPLRQHDRLQDGLPFPRRIVDHALVGQELVEVPSHGPVIVTVWRAQIGDENPDPRRRHRRMIVGRVHQARGAKGLVHGVCPGLEAVGCVLSEPIRT